MARILAGGGGGWFVAVLPLVVVNALGYTGVLDPAQAAFYGASALALGILLGGLLAGRIGSRPHSDSQQDRAGGPRIGAGALAATLYVFTLLGICLVARHLGVLPPVIVIHPVRMALVILFFGSTLFAIAVMYGLWAGRSTPPAGRTEPSSAGAPFRGSRRDTHGSYTHSAPHRESVRTHPHQVSLSSPRTTSSRPMQSPSRLHSAAARRPPQESGETFKRYSGYDASDVHDAW